jgi:ATP-dependent DNA helicase RecG
LTILVLPRTLDAPVSALPKVKPADVKRLAKLGIVTIRDLLLTLPFDWEAYGAPAEVSQLIPGKQASVIGTITAISAKVTPRRRMKLTEATVRDDSGAGLKLV